MPDVFISYSSQDSELARWIFDQLRARDISTFLAELSLDGGANWKSEIMKNLSESDFVLFLATPHSCRSDAVKHEIGGALVLNKAFVPIMANVQVQDLPAWIQDKQAIDIADGAQTRQVFDAISSAVSSKRFTVCVRRASPLVNVAFRAPLIGTPFLRHWYDASGLLVAVTESVTGSPTVAITSDGATVIVGALNGLETVRAVRFPLASYEYSITSPLP